MPWSSVKVFTAPGATSLNVLMVLPSRITTILERFPESASPFRFLSGAVTFTVAFSKPPSAGVTSTVGDAGAVSGSPASTFMFLAYR